jgi:hypothetical protein
MSVNQLEATRLSSSIAVATHSCALREIKPAGRSRSALKLVRPEWIVASAHLVRYSADRTLCRRRWAGVLAEMLSSSAGRWRRIWVLRKRPRRTTASSWRVKDSSCVCAGRSWAGTLSQKSSRSVSCSTSEDGSLRLGEREQGAEAGI